MKKLFYIGALSALLLAACGDEEAKPKEGITDVEEKEEEAKKEKEVKQEPTGITLDEYEMSFKNAFNEIKDNANVSFGEMEEGENGRFVSTLNKDIMLFVEVNKENEVTKVNVAAMSSAVNDYNDELRWAMQALMMGIDKNITSTQQSVIFDKLGITGDEKMLDHTDTYNFNDIKFAYRAKNEEGTLNLQAKLK